MDEIRRRLAEIDKQLDQCPSYYHKQAVTTAPLMFCALGMIGGIIIQNNLPVPEMVWLALLVFCFLFLVMAMARGLERVNIAAYLALVCFICVGAMRLAYFNQPAKNDIRNFVGDEQTLATVRGIIETEPYAEKRNWQFAKFKFTDPASSFYLLVTEAEMTTGWAKATGFVRVRVNEPLMGFKAGDNIQICCWLDRFKNATNPGEFDLAKYLSRKGVFVGASAKSRQAIELLGIESAGLFAKTKIYLRKIAVVSLLGGPYPENESESLLLALVLGHRANIEPETFEAFRKTGLLHFICLSGMNFGVVIWFVWWMCKTAGLMKPARAFVCIIAAILFLMVVPENAPAFRAAVMCFAFCGAFIFRRKSNPFNSLALAAIVLLLIRPTELYEPGWQLSFESVLGILLFAKPFYNFLRDKGLELFGEPDKGGILFRIAAKIASVLWSAFTVSLAAWLSIAGIMLYHFHTIQLLTSVWTVLVSPLIGLVSILGYLKLFITLLSPSIGAALGAIVNFLADILIYIVKLIARLDISEILIGKTFAVAIILYYAVLAYAFFFHQKFQFKKAVCASAAVSLVALVVLPGWQSAYREGLTVTVLDVGHGQAVLAELPDNTNMLFDAGSLSRDDIGTRVVLPFLRYKGIDKIDAVIIGHGDIDHINGLPEINESCRVERFYSNKAFFEEGKDKLTIKFLRGLIEVNDINEMQTACGPAIIKILWPDYETCQNNQISDNDKSAVTMLEYKDRSILICSDIEKPAQKEILRLYPDLRADVVIAPHHGSRKTTDWSFLEQLRPEVVISSCATSAQEKGQVIKGNFYTGTDGAVTVRIDKKGVLTVQKFIKEKPRR